jgi:CubicO group peptidase (beta-lactamase class C family)
MSAAAGAAVLAGVIWSAAAPPLQASATREEAETRKVDAVFAAFDNAHSPGCAVGVVRDGALAYARGYGQASVELGVPITPRTVFDIGSVSKQFTAASILLLAQDRALSLDDDIRKYLPEIPAYERPVTIRHLLTHTSGLRDYTLLLSLADYDSRDLTTVPQALAMVARQRGTDFAAGERFRYNNTGFFLAALIVERVTRQPFPEFAASRIFRPLGMGATRYAGSHAISVPGRATGYSPTGEGVAIEMSNWEQVGDGGVQTSIEDMVRWVTNFDTHLVGTPALAEAMATPATLASGTRTAYGLGQFVGTYRGLPRVHHGGSWGGYRAALQRYPGEKTSVIVLCNRSNVNPEALADGVADAVLGAHLAPIPADGAQPAAAPPDVSTLAGTYWDEADGDLLTFEAKDGRLAVVSGERRLPLTASGDGRFASERPYKVQFTFATATDGARRVERIIEERERATYVRQQPWTPGAAGLLQLAGTWYSDELDAEYDLRVVDGGLARVPRRGSAEPLVPAFEGAFAWGDAVIRITDRDRLEVLTGAGPHGIRFTRRSTPAAGSR